MLLEREQLKAIPTQYRRIQFKSTLAAKWAVFFDHIETQWIYREKPAAHKIVTNYTPDFYLKNVGWIDITPKMDFLSQKLPLIRRFAGEAISHGQSYFVFCSEEVSDHRIERWSRDERFEGYQFDTCVECGFSIVGRNRGEIESSACNENRHEHPVFKIRPFTEIFEQVNRSWNVDKIDGHRILIPKASHS